MGFPKKVQTGILQHSIHLCLKKDKILKKHTLFPETHEIISQKMAKLGY